jgi:hypothetical protein
MKKNLKRFSFGFNVAGLNDFVNEQNRPELLTRAFFEGKTASTVSVQDGIKFADKLNYMAVDVFFQSGEACGFNPTGSVILTQKQIQVYPVKVNMQFCPKDLRKKWANIYLQAGVYQDTMPFEEAFARHMSELMGEQLELMYWRSNIAAGTGNLAFFDGLITQIDAGGAINGNTGTGWTPIAVGTGITTTNVLTIFQNMWRQLPAKLEGKRLVYFCGYDTFKTLIEKLLADDNYHYDGVDGTAYETGVLTLPGTGLEVMATHGLTGTSRIFLTQPENLFLGFDVEGEEDNFDIWFSKDDQVVKFRSETALGTQVAFNNEVVQFTLIP